MAGSSSLNNPRDLGSGLSGLTTAEVDQLKKINSSTISTTQWGYVGGANQAVTTTSKVQFGGSILGAIDKIVASTANIVDVFLYDTSKDTDDGAWIDRVSHTAWENETLVSGLWLGQAANEATARAISGAADGDYYYDTGAAVFRSLDAGAGATEVFRGNKRKYSRLVLITAETNRIVLWDATDPDLPMWMVFNVNSNTQWWKSATAVAALAALDGEILVGSVGSGIRRINFIRGDIRRHAQEGLAARGTIADRNSAGTINYIIDASQALVSTQGHAVTITVLPGAPIDAVTGLPIPTGIVGTDSGASVINNDSTVADLVQTSGDDVNEVIFNKFGDVIIANETAGELDIWRAGNYASDSTTPDDLYTNASIPALLANPTTTKNGLVDANGVLAIGSASGLTLIAEDRTTIANGMVAHITKTDNTLWMAGDMRGAWLGATGLTDLSVHGNDLTHAGTVPTAAVATGAELLFHGPYTSNNYFWAASNAEWDVITTGSLTLEGWFKSSGNSAIESYGGFANAGNTVRFLLTMAADGKINCIDDGATAAVTLTSSIAYDDGLPHHVAFVRISSTSRRLYIDRVLVASNTTDAGSLTGTGALPWAIGIDPDKSTTPATTSLLSSIHLTAYAPSQAQVTKMYEDGKFLFRDNADAFLNDNKSNAVASVGYDEDSDLLLVGTGDGTSFFRGLKRVKYVDLAGTPTNDTIISVSAARGAYLIGTGAETVYNEPAHILREDEIKVDRDTQPPEITFTGGTTDATASTVVAALPIYEGESATITLTVDAHEPTLPGGENATYEIIANVYRTVGGNITVQGQTAVSTIESTGSMACVVAANTTDQTLEVQVTGVASTVIKWTTHVSVVSNIERWAR